MCDAENLNNLKTSESMIAVIKKFEGLRLKAYKCPAGVYTIGYGHTENVCADSEISELKKNTSTYRALKGSRIYAENIENKFANDSFYGIKKRNIREYKPYAKIDDMYIYRHKSKFLWYICSIQALNIPEYSSRDNALAFYQGIGREMPLAYSKGNLEFSDFTTKSKFMKIIE